MSERRAKQGRAARCCKPSCSPLLGAAGSQDLFLPSGTDSYFRILLPLRGGGSARLIRRAGASDSCREPDQATEPEVRRINMFRQLIVTIALSLPCLLSVAGPAEA